MRIAGLKEALFVILLGVVSTTVMMHPLVLKMDRVGRINTGDGQVSLWTVAWVAHALTEGHTGLFDANIFYPHRNALAFSEPNIGAGVLAIPVWLATHNPYFAHNSAVFLAFVIGIAGAYYWARYLTGHRGAAVFAAMAFSFCPYIYARTAHIQLLMIGGIPWSLWACHRLVDRPTASRALTLGGVLAAEGLACGYYGLFAGLSVALAVVFYACARGLWRSWQFWLWTALAAGVAVGVVTPFLMPLFGLEEADFGSRFTDAAMWSANWQAYLASPTWAHRWMLQYVHDWKEVVFPGFVTTGLGLSGLAWLMGRHDVPSAGVTRHGSFTAGQPRETLRFYGLLGGLAFWCSLGPAAGLYLWLSHTIPAFGFMRAPGRMGLMVTFALVACAAVALASFARLRPGRERVLVASAIVLTLCELTSVPLALPDVDPTPAPVYQTLARLPRGPVAEFPFFWSRPDFPRHASYMLNSTAHWMPLVNGYSDHIPSDFREMVLDVSSFPTRAAFHRLEQRRVRYVIFHLNLYDSRSREKLLERLSTYAEFLAPIHKDGDRWLYQIVSWPRS